MLTTKNQPTGHRAKSLKFVICVKIPKADWTSVCLTPHIFLSRAAGLDEVVATSRTTANWTTSWILEYSHTEENGLIYSSVPDPATATDLHRASFPLGVGEMRWQARRGWMGAA